MKKIQVGFTLLELVTAIAVMGVLTAIAVPAYQSNVMRSNRAAAKGMLADLASKQEAQALRRSQYVTDFTALVGNSNANTTSFYLSRSGKISKSLNGNGTSIYMIELLSPTTSSFTLSATAVGKQAKDRDCQTFTLTSAGQRNATASGSGNSSICWN